MALRTSKPTHGLLPEGTYEVILKDGGYMDVTKGGKPYMNIPLVVRNDIEQKGKNAYIWDAIWTGSSQKHIDYKFNNISDAVGIPYDTEFPDLEKWGEYIKGKCMRVKITHEEYNGEPSLNVSGYSKTEHPDCKHIFKKKVDPDEFEAIDDDDDGDLPF